MVRSRVTWRVWGENGWEGEGLTSPQADAYVDRDTVASERISSGSHLDIIDAAGRYGYRLADALFDLRNSLAGRHAAGQVQDVGGVVFARLLDHDGVSHGCHLHFLRIVIRMSSLWAAERAVRRLES